MAVCSLWHCLADHSGWVLPTALPYGARTFLGAAANRERRDRPADPFAEPSLVRAAVRTSRSGASPVSSVVLRRLGDAEVEGKIDGKIAEQQPRSGGCGLTHRQRRGFGTLPRGVHHDLVVEEERQMRTR